MMFFGHCNGGNSLQNAIDLADAGSTISLPAGTYTGSFTFDKSLTLSGEVKLLYLFKIQILIVMYFQFVLVHNDCDVTFENLTVRTAFIWN